MRENPLTWILAQKLIHLAFLYRSLKAQEFLDFAYKFTLPFDETYLSIPI